MMVATSYTCPQCLHAVAREDKFKFCPRCGLAIDANATDAAPVELQIDGQTFRIETPIAFGEISNLYHCTSAKNARKCLFKIARDAASNRFIKSGVEKLQRLHAADSSGKYGPFLPTVIATTALQQTANDTPRAACVLGYHNGINTPDELYSLEEVIAAYPTCIDPRDMAWIWRRLLTILGFVGDQKIAHANITPDHILIEPRDHKLIIVGWSGAVLFGQIPELRQPKWQEIYDQSHAATHLTDLSMAARSMLYLLGDKKEPGIERHLERVSESSSHAWKLLDDFDRLIEALWGSRQFRSFVMPARR